MAPAGGRSIGGRRPQWWALLLWGSFWAFGALDFLPQPSLAIQGLSSPPQTTSPMMDNLRRQMGRLQSHRRPPPLVRAPRLTRKTLPPPPATTKKPQLINKQSVLDIRLKLSLIETQIKEIKSLLDSLSPTGETNTKTSPALNTQPAHLSQLSSITSALPSSAYDRRQSSIAGDSLANNNVLPVYNSGQPLEEPLEVGSSSSRGQTNDNSVAATVEANVNKYVTQMLPSSDGSFGTSSSSSSSSSNSSPNLSERGKANSQPAEGLPDLPPLAELKPPPPSAPEASSSAAGGSSSFTKITSSFERNGKPKDSGTPKKPAQTKPMPPPQQPPPPTPPRPQEPPVPLNPEFIGPNGPDWSWEEQQQYAQTSEEQQDGEGGGVRRKRKKHRLREAVKRGAKKVKDTASKGLQKAQQYSPVVDVATRKVQMHVVPRVNEAIVDSKEMVHIVADGLTRTRSRRKAHKVNRKLSRSLSVVAGGGAQTEVSLERGVPDMLGAYPNVPPEAPPRG